jgi:hypothetical protein
MTPRSIADSWIEASKSKDAKDKDYFGISKSGSRGQIDKLARSGLREQDPNTQSPAPHIAFQEKGRTTSSESSTKSDDGQRRSIVPISKLKIPDDTRLQHAKDSDSARTQSPKEKFQLQEAPKSKRSTSTRSDSQSEITSPGGGSIKSIPPRGTPRSESTKSLLAAERQGASRTSQDSRQVDESNTRPSFESAASSQQQIRGDSGSSVKSTISRKEVPAGALKSSMDSSSETSPSTASSDTPGVTPTVNGKSISGPLIPSPMDDDLVPPTRASGRPAPPQHQISGSYMAPRAPPAPPAGQNATKEVQLDANGQPISPKLPRWSAGGDFTMDEDMARILGGTDESSQSILRRVSNAVRHGRNSSDQSARGHSRSMSESTKATMSPRWQKTSIAEGGQPPEISSPISIASPAPGSDQAVLRRQLRNSEQRVAELERQLGTDGDIKDLNKKLLEKRKTVSVLDSQAEIIIRQIETLAGYVEKAKDNKEPVNFPELEDSAIKDFVQKLEKLKQSMSAAVEALYEERNELLEEKIQIMTDRDRALMEFEQLSSKNAQLAEMNNDLTHQIQERFKVQSGLSLDARLPMNGLGIYTHHSKDKSNASVNLDDFSLRPSNGTTAVGSYPHSMEQDAPMEPATVLAAPHVVNIRKGQAKKFNWKKGGQSVAKGVTKGFKGAFSSANQQNQWQGQSGDSIGMPYNMTAAPTEFPTQSTNSLPRSASNDPRQGGGFALFKKSQTGAMPKSQSNGNIQDVGAADPSVLFGSDLVERADFERRQIPSVVTRCIEEVELRGMDIEGIYRKTGGNSQVKLIQEGFDKSGGEDYDISDPDLDITAVTSVLKQYFRKLPVPLLTFDVYDRVLESCCKSSFQILNVLWR